MAAESLTIHTWPVGGRAPSWALRSIAPLGLDRLRHRRGAIALAGTWPLGIALPTSDLDILLEAVDVARLKAELDTAFADIPGYRSARIDATDGPAAVAQLPVTPVPIEIFAQALPVTEQMAYRHMIVEGRLLDIAGRPLQDRVRHLKRAGLKTEPAFARALGLPGNPYTAVLNLERQSDAVLRALVGAGPSGG